MTEKSGRFIPSCVQKRKIENRHTLEKLNFSEIESYGTLRNLVLDPASQLYNQGYYQLFVRATDTIFTEEDLFYPNPDVYETHLVNIKVLDFEITPEDDNVIGFSDRDNIDGLAGNDTINGLAGDDTLMGNEGSDRLL